MTSIARAWGRPWMGPSIKTGEMRIRQTGRLRPGFTLIEIIIVFALIGILVGLALPRYQHARRKAQEAVLKEDLFQFRKLIDQYYSDKGKYPATLRTLVEENYLRTLPLDPMTGSADTWQEIKDQPSFEELVPGVEYGIVDVRSGSQAKALDGTTYDTW